ncbi:response regulator [Methanococcoides seepicolus]|uniref:Response regulator n=1 Tax=Methanococcoides seepicolus TaxID=2828780 RepID=A0A9E4ZHZ1_9EURY|nr:response regulator [Methanococcoides seepicolus]MCM1987404.1 response regulator [Methanococcoides seepicolus]
MTQKRSKILIIDNENDNVEILEAILSSDYEVIKAYSGCKGLEIAIAESPDIIILDIMIPDITGHELCRTLKKDERTKLIPIIMLTSRAEKKEKIKSLEEVADDFLNKPVSHMEILSRVQSLLKIKHLQENIIKERNQAYKYLDAAGTIIVIINTDTEIVFANQKTCDIFGWEKKDIRGKSWIDFIPENGRERRKQDLLSILSGKAQPPEYYERLVVTKNADGTFSERMILWHDVILKDDEGKITGLIRSGDDTTERKNIEEELSKANEKLQISHKLKDEFLANINHELRTPLISIKGFSDLLYNERLGDLNEHQKKTMESVVRNSERLQHLIESLFYVSEMQNETIKYTFSLINIKKILEMIKKDMFPQIDQKGIEVTTDISDSLSPVHGNAKYIESVLMHLLGNAIKYTPSGRKISILASEENGDIHIVIKDTGKGIPKEMLTHIFSEAPEEETECDICYCSQDYGLIICKKIIEAHRGTIWINSEVDQGTEIHVKLPVFVDKGPICK